MSQNNNNNNKVPKGPKEEKEEDDNSKEEDMLVSEEEAETSKRQRKAEQPLQQQEPEQEQQEHDSEEENNDDDDTRRNAFMQNFFQGLLAGRMRGNATNQHLIETLKERGILSNPKLEEALLKIPRGAFVPKSQEDEAYDDNPIRLPSMGFNISAPHMYAACLQNLDLQLGESFLDIGSGCGHFTALAGYLVGKYGVSHGFDLRQDIIKFAEEKLKDFCTINKVDLSNVKFFVRNCFLPTAKTRKYDKIHVGACCPNAQIDGLLDLLNPGGILVTPYEDKLVKFTKDEKGQVKQVKLMGVRYSDLIIPSEAEIKESQRELEREKATTINVPASTFPHDITKLFNNTLFSDVTFKVEGKLIPAHRLILACRSEHFKAMFYNGLKESQMQEIVLPEMQYDLFLDCLKYIYTDDADIKTADHAVDLLPVVNYLKLDRLKAICEGMIKNNIDVESAAYLLQVASRYEAWQLKSFALDFIMRNYAEVEKTKAFDDLEKPLLIEVTKAAMKYVSL